MHNKILFLFVLLIQIIFSTKGYSKCLKNIYSAGLSLDSFVYDVKESSADSATLVSKSGNGFKLAWLQYCPDSKLEFTEYFRLRSFELDIKDRIFDGLSGNQKLISLGFETRYIWKPKIELIGEIAIRDEMGLRYDENRQVIVFNPYQNAKIAIGSRYFIKSRKNEDYAMALKLGSLSPMNDEGKANGGQVLDLNFEYFRRLASKYSLKADIYYSYYKQEYDGVDFSRQELGLRANYIFRY